MVNPNDKPRVVVTGMGLATPPESAWRRPGQPCAPVAPARGGYAPTRALHVQIGCQIDDFDPTD
jgi:hypothetical protein